MVVSAAGDCLVGIWHWVVSCIRHKRRFSYFHIKWFKLWKMVQQQIFVSLIVQTSGEVKDIRWDDPPCCCCCGCGCGRCCRTTLGPDGSSLSKLRTFPLPLPAATELPETPGTERRRPEVLETGCDGITCVYQGFCETPSQLLFADLQCELLLLLVPDCCSPGE